MTAFDEMYGLGGPEAVREVYGPLRAWLEQASPDLLAARRSQAEHFFQRIGITFAVYGENEASERLIPFDVIPRILAAREWSRIERGLVQRVQALNAFLNDVYGPREILRAGKVPEALVLQNPQFRLEMTQVRPPHGVHVHICGVDLVRTAEDEVYVLEDNCRTPSGVSYMLENREVMFRLFPELFSEYRVKPVETYPDALAATLRSVAPRGDRDPTMVVLTPGQYNSAYYEHSFLADKLGVELVEGTDLLVREDVVYMRTTEGPQRVDVIYRRVDDDFLDPLIFRPDSTLGIAGLVNAYRAGNVALANSIGTGVADDKAVYAYVPEIIKYYLGEDAILSNVETFLGSQPKHLSYILDNLDKLVVKATNESGGYGMLMGPQASQAERDEFRVRVAANPRNYIAQPLISLSTAPAFVEDHFEARHVDLRPFILYGKEGVTIIPGGLTRVALRKGSFVVNSSQGGGSKDTWVLARDSDLWQSMGGMSQQMGAEGMTQSMGTMAPMTPLESSWDWEMSPEDAEQGGQQ